MKKDNIRSFRFSDDVLKILEDFEGTNLNDKFNKIVRYCFMERPEIEKRLSELNAELKEKYKRLLDVRKQLNQLAEIGYQVTDIEKRLAELELTSRYLLDGVDALPGIETPGVHYDDPKLIAPVCN